MSSIIQDGPFIGLPMNDAGALLIDPPYHFKRYSEKKTPANRGRAPQDHYDTMTLLEMKSLPIYDLAARNSILFLWSTWPHLPQAMELIHAWGFQYKTCAFDWMKANVSTLDLFPDPKTAAMSMGYWTRSNSEPCLLATKGRPKRKDAGVRMGIIEPAREHSRKPDCIYDRIQRLVDGPYYEIFARTRRSGWTSWGNQTEKFSPPALVSESPLGDQNQ